MIRESLRMRAEGGFLLHRAGRFMVVMVGMCILALSSGCSGHDRREEQPVLSLENLLDRMTNITAMAQRPWGDSFLVSSYDKTGGNQDWAVWTPDMVNEHGRITLLDVDGPGYLSRIWSTSLRAKRWFFFDGGPDPRLVLTQAELFGDRFPFVPPLSEHRGGANCSLVPIPFSSGLRIEVEPSRLRRTDRNYYHINYTLGYGDDKAESWPATISSSLSNKINAVCAELEKDNDDLSELASELCKNGVAAALPPGGECEILNERGKGMIEGLAIRIDAPSPPEVLQHELLRRLRLRIWWDGTKEPSVDVPLGDFFCNPFYIRHYESRLLGRVDGMYACRIPMPFRRGARVTIENHGDVPVELRAGIHVGDWLSSGRYFHADWSASDSSGATFIMGECEGAGHYAGCFLTAIGQDGSWTILEGDERVEPDIGKQPAQHGTGLEDYFNGAYYYESLFDEPFHGLIEKGAMRTDQYRFHALDAVNFEDGFRMSIEFGDQNRAQGYMSSVMYWYADKPRSCTINPTEQRLLSRPADRFELAGFMAMLFLLEREGLWEDAAVRCEYMAKRYAGRPWADLLHLRSAGYIEKAKGFGAARETYEKLSRSRYAPAARQAQDLLWWNQNKNKTGALLGMHMRGKYRLWIDGEDIAHGESQAVLETRRLQVAPGVHTWEVEFEPTMPYSFVSLCLRTKWGDITSSGPWKIIETELHPGTRPPKKLVGDKVLPKLSVWQFEPNGYVGMQSGSQVVKCWNSSNPGAPPPVKRVRMKQVWTNQPSAFASSLDRIEAPVRTEDELKEHTIE